MFYLSPRKKDYEPARLLEPRNENHARVCLKEDQTVSQKA